VSRSAHQATRPAFTAPTQYSWVMSRGRRLVPSPWWPPRQQTYLAQAQQACPAGLRQTPWRERPHCSGRRPRASDTQGGWTQHAELPPTSARLLGRTGPARTFWVQGPRGTGGTWRTGASVVKRLRTCRPALHTTLPRSTPHSLPRTDSSRAHTMRWTERRRLEMRRMQLHQAHR